MKEVLKARLDKEDKVGFKALQEEERQIGLLMGAYGAKKQAFWYSLRMKHILQYSKVYYIKGNAIYTQEM